MNTKTNAELIAEARHKIGPINSATVAFGDLLFALADRLEAADRRIAELEARIQRYEVELKRGKAHPRLVEIQERSVPVSKLEDLLGSWAPDWASHGTGMTGTVGDLIEEIARLIHDEAK